MNSTFNLKHESRKIKQSCAGRWAGVKPRCFARVSAPHSPWQTFLNNKQKRGSGQGPHATTKETATTGTGKQTQSRQWQADTGRPEVKERHGGAKETDRPMKDFLWGGEERGLNKASARPIPPATILLFCHRHNETPNHSFDITFTSREPHRIFYLMIIMVTRAGGWGRCLDGFKEPSSCGLSVTQQSERETTVSKKCARNDLSLFMLFSQQERERVKLRERGSR